MADRIAAELVVVTRRLSRIEAAVGQVALNGDALAWATVRDRVAEAVGVLGAAVECVPDAPLADPLEGPEVRMIGELRIDIARRDVSFAGTAVQLSKLEYELLATLAEEPTRVHSKAELLERVWGFRSSPRTRTVDSHASRLRLRLAGAGASPQTWVVNEWGVGYALMREPRDGRKVPPAPDEHWSPVKGGCASGP